MRTLKNRLRDPMPTAILRYLTNSGFVITSDGRTTDGKNNVRKIFEINGAPAAYALYGTIRIGDWREEAPHVLDLGLEIRKFVDSGISPHDLANYGQQLADELYASLSKFKEGGAIPRYDGLSEFPNPGTTIALILLFGYSEGRPNEVDITLWHHDEKIQKPRLCTDGLRRANPLPWGSPLIFRLLFDVKDPRFSKFRSISIPSPPEEISLWGAASVGESYIQACDSEEGRSADPWCSNIGGKIRIAAITPVEGFSWMEQLP